MALLHSVVAGAILFSPAVQEGAGSCSVEFELLGKHIWTLKVDSKTVKGDRQRLERDGKVLSGFLDGRTTRLRLSKGVLAGTMAGQRAELFLKRTAESLEIHGNVGLDRLIAIAGPQKIILANQYLQLELNRMRAPAGKAVYIDGTSSAGLVLDGCHPVVLARRPELLLVLNRMVLWRVMELEYLTERISRNSRGRRSLRNITP